MKKAVWVSLISAVALGCTGADPAPSGDGAGAGGTTGGGGATGAGGSSGSGAGGVTGAGGLTGAGGSAGAGGTSGGSAGSAGSAGTAGSGGAGGSSGGSAGSAGSAGTAGGGSGGTSQSPPVPSDGCGNGGRPAGGQVAVDNQYVYRFPESYDGSTPMPMILMLHACGNPEEQIPNLSNNTKLADEFVRIAPKASGSCWSKGATDDGRINTVFNQVLADYCVDTSRIFLTGHSSGAQMAVQMICAGDDRFKGVAPVAASKYCNEVDPIPTMYIQGIQDAQRGGSDGSDVAAVFESSNSCDGGSTDYPVGACNSTFNGKAVDAGCVSYNGCDEPTVYCKHNDEGYNGSDGHYHGWPCFASEAMADFFLALP